jgi:cell wall-associated NlpC family hydrolase
VGKIALATVGALVLIVILIGAAGAGVASALGFGSSGGGGPAVCGTGAAGVGSNLGDGETLTATQVANAQIISQVGVQLGIPAYGQEIAIATAIQESRLENLTTAVDHDSLGLFQQRPSAGWGTPAELTDPVYASTKFYQALQKVPNWQSLPLTTAAQDVQDSAYPDAYAPWQMIASQLVATFAGTAVTCPTGADAAPGQAAAAAIAYAQAQIGLPYQYGGDGPGVNGSTGFDCSGLTQAAYQAAGIQLPRVAQDQYNATTKVPLNALEPGDLVFFGTSTSEITHVGIFVGGDMMIDAPHIGAFVRQEDYRWSDLVGATQPS